MTQQHLDTTEKMMLRLYGLIINNPSNKELAKHAPVSSSAISALQQAYTLIKEEETSLYTQKLLEKFKIMPERRMLKEIVKDPLVEAIPREVHNLPFAMAKVCFEFYMLAIEVDHLKNTEPNDSYDKVAELITAFFTRKPVKKFPKIQQAFYEQTKKYADTPKAKSDLEKDKS